MPPPIRRTSNGAPFKARLPLSVPGQRIGLMGGTFDPPHAAHAMIARTAMKRLRLSQVWWLVTPGNPLKSRALPPLSDRIAACRRLVPERAMKISGVEAALGTRYSVDTLSILRRRLPGRRLVWIMGADNLALFHHWRDWRTIFRLMPVAVIDRPGWHLRALASPAARTFAASRVPESSARRLADKSAPAWIFLSGPLSDLSSTAIRARLGR